MAKKEDAVLDELIEETAKEAAPKKARATVIDCIHEDKYARYQEIVAQATEKYKADTPKAPRVKKEKTAEEKLAEKKAKAAKLEAEIAAMLAEQTTHTTV